MNKGTVLVKMSAYVHYVHFVSYVVIQQKSPSLDCIQVSNAVLLVLYVIILCMVLVKALNEKCKLLKEEKTTLSEQGSLLLTFELRGIVV